MFYWLDHSLYGLCAKELLVENSPLINIGLSIGFQDLNGITDMTQTYIQLL